jgi:uronate dehydrogenase
MRDSVLPAVRRTSVPALARSTDGARCKDDEVHVVITGAAGRIGQCLMEGLSSVGHNVRGIDVKPAGDSVIVADLVRDDEALAGLMDGADAVVHLAAVAAETDFVTAVDSHIGLTHRVLEAAVRHRVSRVVYASSNHAVGFTPRAAMVAVETPARPDTFYGFGKAACEALCSLYHDRHSLRVACLRIGSFRDRPTSRRHLSTWLSPGDAVRLVDACLRSPDLGFAIVYGISANTRAWWDLAPARALGYRPADDAEGWAAEIETTPPSEDDELDARYVGGDFARPW